MKKLLEFTASQLPRAGTAVVFGNEDFVIVNSNGHFKVYG